LQFHLACVPPDSPLRVKQPRAARPPTRPSPDYDYWRRMLRLLATPGPEQLRSQCKGWFSTFEREASQPEPAELRSARDLNPRQRSGQPAEGTVTRAVPQPRPTAKKRSPMLITLAKGSQSGSGMTSPSHANRVSSSMGC